MIARPTVILMTDESKIQTCVHFRNGLRFDGAVLWVCHLLLATVSTKSLAIVVHQRHPNLVHREFCDFDVADAAESVSDT